MTMTRQQSKKWTTNQTWNPRLFFFYLLFKFTKNILFWQFGSCLIVLCPKLWFQQKALTEKIIHSDIESNHKSVKLSVVEEGDRSSENSDTQSASQSQTLLKAPSQDFHLESAASSAENLAANTRANQRSNYSHTSLKVPDENTNARRPSILLEMQEMISGRRPSAIMASLRRGSQSILAPFRTKHDDPNDHTGFKSPEAMESRRKNRRYGE